MKKVGIFSFAFGLAMASGTAFGNGVPHTFTAGTPAKASEVNENFTDLSDRLETVDERVDAVNQRVDAVDDRLDNMEISPGAGTNGPVFTREQLSVTQGTFTYVDQAARDGSCDRLTSTYASNGNKVTRTDVLWGSEYGTPEAGECEKTIRTFELIDGHTRLTQTEHINSDHPTEPDLNFTIELAPAGLLTWAPTMQAGQSYASVLETRHINTEQPEGVGLGADIWITSYHPTSGAFWGRDGEHEGCLVLYLSRPVSNSHEARVHCPGVGPVYIRQGSGLAARHWELESYTP